jgi:uncharacterized protein
MIRTFAAACGLALAALAVASFTSSAGAQGVPAMPHIPQLSVRGEAELQKPADELQISLGVVTEASDATAALRENNERAQRVMQALSRVGLGEKEYETGRFQVQPMYSQRPPRGEPDWTPRIVGYRVVNSVRVKTQQLALAGRIIMTAQEAGANSIDSIHFGLANPRIHRAEAIAEATKNAISDAQALADAAGLRLVRVISINLDDAMPIRPVMMERSMAMGMPDMSEPPITPGDVTVRATVNLMYEIAPTE